MLRLVSRRLAVTRVRMASVVTRTPVRALSVLSTSRQQQSRTNFAGFAAAAAVGVAAGALLLNNAENEEKKTQLLQGDKWNSLKLSEIRPYNHNTATYVFDLETPTTKLGMPVASFVLVRATVDDKEEVRPYTPIDTDIPGKLILLVKKYDNGKVSKAIANLKVGDKLDVKGPIPKLAYSANMKKEIGMIAGGSGLTPMLQVLETILKNPADKTKVSFVFANVTEKDILLRERLDKYAKDHADRFSVYYVLDNASAEWKQGKGRVSEELVKSKMPAPSNDSLVLVCGPPGMMSAISGNKAPDYSQGPVDGILKKLNYTSDMVYKF